MAAPDIPTIAEAGVPGYGADAWYGLLAPRGTPQQFRVFLKAEMEQWGKVVREARIRAE